MMMGFSDCAAYGARIGHRRESLTTRYGRLAVICWYSWK